MTVLNQPIVWDTNMKWADWNGNLLHYFGEEPIPYYADENNWRSTANSVVSLPSFATYLPPDPNNYETWQDWANEFTIIINGNIL